MGLVQRSSPSYYQYQEGAPHQNEVLVPGVLTNQTVVAGQAIHLTCRVDTHTMHPLHWLKEVDTKEINKNESQLNYLQIGDQKYKVLLGGVNSRVLVGEKFYLPDATYQHSLTIIPAQISDSGLYVCMVYSKDQQSKLSPLTNQS